MKKTRRAVSALLCAAMICLLLCTCGSSTVRDDVAVSDIAAKVSQSIGKADSLVEADANYIKGYMKTDPEKFGGYTMLINAYGVNIDEFGIFKAGENMSAEDIKAVVESYLQLRLDSWMDEYMPEEKPKLTGAEVKLMGSYVMYCILSDADKTTAFAAFEEALTK